MNRLHKISFTLLALASFLFATPATAQTASNGVVDGAHIFSQDAISRADQIARQIEDLHKRQVLVQTFSAVPDDLQSKLQSDGKDRFFSEWSHQLGREKHLTGILILICMKPGHVEVTVGTQTQQIFHDRDALTQLLLSDFRAKQYDRGLVDAMQYIAEHMTRPRANNGAPAAGGNYQGGQTTAPPPVSSPSSSSTHSFFPFSGCICAAIALVIILMLVASLTRRRGGYTGGYGPGGAGYPPGGYPPGGYQQSGGGFGRGFLGGLLGGALGSWGYDRMRGNQGGQANVPPPMGGANPPDANLPPDTSYSSSGGDFDSSDPGGSSGGDFGGSSGGDFGGGGDMGGGGGDFGGGGGDAGGSSGGDF